MSMSDFQTQRKKETKKESVQLLYTPLVFTHLATVSWLWIHSCHPTCKGSKKSGNTWALSGNNWNFVLKKTVCVCTCVCTCVRDSKFACVGACVRSICIHVHAFVSLCLCVCVRAFVCVVCIRGPRD